MTKQLQRITGLLTVMGTQQSVDAALSLFRDKARELQTLQIGGLEEIDTYLRKHRVKVYVAYTAKGANATDLKRFAEVVQSQVPDAKCSVESLQKAEILQ